MARALSIQSPVRGGAMAPFAPFARLLGPALAGALIAGCATRPAPPAPPVTRPAEPARPAPSSADYVERAGSASLALVRASQQMAARLRDPALAALATRIVADHRGIAGQLSFAGRRLNLLPPAVPGAADTARLERLAAAGDGEAAYRQFLAASLAENAALHAAFAERGDSPTLRQVARLAGPMVEAQLAGLRAR